LGLKPGATLQEIKTAYRKLSKKFHPDVNQGDSFFEERFKEIQEAYEKLSGEKYRDSFERNDEPTTPNQPPKTETPKEKPKSSYTSAQNKTKPAKPVESGQNNFSKVIGFIVIAIISIVIKQAIKSNNSTSTQIPIESVEPYQEQYNIPASLPEEVKVPIWNQFSFFNCTFQIPDNLQVDESSSSESSRLYVDNDTNVAITFNAQRLDDDRMNASVEDYRDNLQSFANTLNENSKRNFDDFKLLNYEISDFGNVKAIKIQQSSTKVSGIKDIEMRITVYYILAAPYLYTININRPEDSTFYQLTLNKVIESFNFENQKITTVEPQDENLDYDNGDFSILKSIYFSHGRASFPKRVFPDLQSTVAILKERMYAYVKVEGHTDSNGTDYENIQLSEDRANAVKNYLIENGIPPNKIVIEGFGETQPKGSNYTQTGEDANNRVEIKIYDVN